MPTTWMTITEAARAAGVTPDTIRRWCDSGKLPAIRTGGNHRRIDEQGLYAMLSDGPTAALSLSPATKDLAAVIDNWRDQVESLRPFVERPADTYDSIDDALRALRGPLAARRGGLLGALEGLIRELEEVLDAFS